MKNNIELVFYNKCNRMKCNHNIHKSCNIIKNWNMNYNNKNKKLLLNIMTFLIKQMVSSKL